MARSASTALFLCAIAVSTPARADRVTDAEALFLAAKELTRQQDFEQACPKFEASYELDPQLGVLMNIADCYEQQGKVATAWARWNAAEEWAKRENDDRGRYIQDRRASLIPRLPKVVISVDAPVEGLEIQRGDVPVPPASYGLEVPVDPGEVVVVVRRGAHVLETRRLQATEGQVVRVQLDLQAIAAQSPLPAADEGGTEYDPTHRNIGIVVTAVGAAAVLAAVGLEIGALVKKGQADAPDACVNRFCAPEGLADAETAATLAEVGQWVGIAGLVTAAAGITILLTAPDEPTPVAIVPELGPTRLGVSFGGRF
jgi:hypothetical protein